MKTLFLVILMGFFAIGSHAQVYTTSELPRLLSKTSQDSILEIERRAAMEFHTLLNNYRSSKGLKRIYWDDTFWLASRNHCIWMAEHNKLSHSQTPNTALFTGGGPGARHTYVAGASSRASWNGENALYNYSAYGTSIKEIADNIAKRSFNQWKGSPGHERNMRRNHDVHGVAFILSGSQVWGTDLFGSDYKRRTYHKELEARYSPKLEVKNKTITKEPVKTAVTTPRLTRKKLKALEDEVIEGLRTLNTTATSNQSMIKAAEEHARYLAYSREVSSIEQRKHGYFYGKTPFMRLMKASKGKELFNRKGTKIRETCTLVTYKTADLPEADILISNLNEAINKEKNAEDQVAEQGMAVYFRKSGGKVKIYVVLMEKVRIVKKNNTIAEN